MLLCGIGDPHNFGAILRSAYYLGVDNVFTADCEFEDNSGNIFLKSIAPLTPVVSKASSGVLEIFQPFHINDAKKFIELRKSEGWSIIGSGLGNRPSAEKIQHSETNICESQIIAKNERLLLIGNEGFGIPKLLSELCDTWFHVKPGRCLDPDVDSLNVSVATSLLIHSIKSGISQES